MSKLDEELDKLDFQSKYNIAIKNLSNWILGIALGLFTISALKLDNNYENSAIFALDKIVVIASMLNLVFSGFIRHGIYIRELRLSENYMEIKRLVYFEKKIIPEEEYKVRLKKYSNDSFNELNKGIEIHRLLNINITTCLITLILFGVLILIK